MKGHCFCIFIPYGYYKAKMIFKEITIYTSRLESQKEFYCQKLGLRLTAENTSSFSVATGTSILNFCYRKFATAYHIAINIPSNKDMEAWDWLKSKVDLLQDEGNSLVNFPKWNATSLYFYDPDLNIIELICRKNLNSNSNKLFNERDFLHISEIGMPVQNIEPVYNMLNSQLDLEIFDGDSERFCAIGEETGLFIVINKKFKKWFPTNDTAYSSDFEAIVETANNEKNIVSFKSGFLDIYKPNLV